VSPRALVRTAVPGPRSLALFEAEQGAIAPGIQSIALLSKIAVARGEGAVVEDLDGNRFIDFSAGVGVASLGHAHPRFVEAISAQAARIAVGSFASESRAELTRLLAEIAPGDLRRTQYYSSGAEAVEAAVRLARSRTGRSEVLGFWRGFHGKTGGVLGLLADDFKHGLGPLHPGLYSSPYAHCYRCPFEARHPDCDFLCARFLRQKVRHETTNDVAAIIVEPVQGTAGNVVPPPGYLVRLKAFAEEIGALLIADEMITGFGRTGRMFGCDHDGVVPDIMTIGKGFASGYPLSGIIAREEIAFSRPFANPSGSSSSYGGNPLAAAAALATVRTILDCDLAGNAERVGSVMLARLRALAGRCPIVGDVRGRGLLIGVGLVKDKATRTPLDARFTRLLFERCLQRGLIVMAYNPEVRINPPLVIDEETAEEGIAILEESLGDVAAAVAGQAS
jgi:4-aminobutyrate aminotransferase / (S)-3-amino-2-methylpropionate transaminase / 5-aminovalerate transaminase